MDVHKMLEQVKAASWILQRQRRSLKICLMRIWAMQSGPSQETAFRFWRNYFLPGKPDPYLKEIFLKFYERDGEVLGTRASQASMS